MGQSRNNTTTKSCHPDIHCLTKDQRTGTAQEGPPTIRLFSVSKVFPWRATWVPLTFCRPEYQYSCGRESKIWEVAPSALVATSTERIKQLSRHKSAPLQYIQQKPQFILSCGRSSPLWRPSRAALLCPERPRTVSLANPKPLHCDYNPPKSVGPTFYSLASFFSQIYLHFSGIHCCIWCCQKVQSIWLH